MPLGTYEVFKLEPHAEPYRACDAGRGVGDGEGGEETNAEDRRKMNRWTKFRGFRVTWV